MRKVEILQTTCPNCSTVQASTSYRRKTCIRCGKKYRIFPENKPSRIADTVKMRANRPYIHELKQLSKYERKAREEYKKILKYEKEREN